MGELPAIIPPRYMAYERVREVGLATTRKIGELATRRDETEEDSNSENIRIVVSEAPPANIDGAQPYSGKYPSARVDQCRTLVAKRYLEEGYVTEDDLNEFGQLGAAIDPYVSDSEYFWRTDDQDAVIATLRIIHPRDHETPLPIEKCFDLFPEQKQVLYEARKNNPASVVEISALAKAEGIDNKAALDMYKAVWQHAKRTGLELCALSADIRLHNMLINTFGDAFQQAGEPAELMGSLTVPSLLHPDKCAEALVSIYNQKLDNGKPISAASYRKLIAYLSYGLEIRYLNSEELAALESIGLAPTAKIFATDH